MGRVLLVGLKKKDQAHLQNIFDQVHVPHETVPNIDGAIEKIEKNPPDLVVAHEPDSNQSLHSLNAVLKAHAPATPFIVTFQNTDVPKALAAMNAGAYDCLAKPYSKFDVLVSAKRACLKKGRTLFVEKLRKRKRPFIPMVTFAVTLISLTLFLIKQYNGPPPDKFSLGSAHLTGLQWQGSYLWVGDWFDSNIIQYRVRKGLFKDARELEATGLYKMNDGQPMLMANADKAMYTIGTDLKMRSHQLSVGLPTIQSVDIPGTRPSGLIWDGRSLWSSDEDTGFLYRHGGDMQVLESVKSILPNPRGLAWDGESIWVVDINPARVARLRLFDNEIAWEGPYHVKNLFTDGVVPSGMAASFDRLWFISGGYPIMISTSIKEITQHLLGWGAAT